MLLAGDKGGPESIRGRDLVSAPSAAGRPMYTPDRPRETMYLACREQGAVSWTSCARCRAVHTWTRIILYPAHPTPPGDGLVSRVLSNNSAQGWGWEWAAPHGRRLCSIW